MGENNDQALFVGLESVLVGWNWLEIQNFEFEGNLISLAEWHLRPKNYATACNCLSKLRPSASIVWPSGHCRGRVSKVFGQCMGFES